MNMKKILSLVLALALCVSIFAACGNGGDSSTIVDRRRIQRCDRRQ